MANETLFKVGAVLDGRYEILSVIGQGGYGVVYKASQLATGQAVAVKLLLTERLSLSADLEAHQARFRRETQVIAGLKHPNIVRLIDSGQTPEGGHMYAVLEYVEGEPLSALIQRHGPLPVRAALRVMSQVLEALHHAHSKGVIHRDLKPQNIMVSGDINERPNAMVLDFGIATLTRGSELSGVDPRTLTQTGQIYGTPAYMAPEQLQGAAMPASDLYAWGLVLIECITGQPAVKGSTLAEVIYHQISSQDPELPKEIMGTGLHTVLARATHKEMPRRYASAAAALSDLEQLNTQPLPARLLSAATPSQPNAPQKAPAPTGPAQKAPGLPAESWAFSEQKRPSPDQGVGQAPTADVGQIAASTKELQQQARAGRWVVWMSLLVGVAFGGLVVALWSPWSSDQPLPVEQPATEGPQLCPAGQQMTRKTNGQCCWPGQSSNGSGSACVGVPSACPQGYRLDPEAETCALLPCHGGRVRMPDGQHCCWQGQAWDTDQGQCVGSNISCDLSLGFYADQQRCFSLEAQAHAEYQACYFPEGDLSRRWPACIALGRRLLIGEGAQLNPVKATVILSEVCAETLEPEACMDAAHLIKIGLLDSPPEVALKLWSSACEKGYARGCFFLAQAQFQGFGVAPSPASACGSLSEACILQDHLACDLLGIEQLPGGRCASNPPDIDKAVRNLSRACDDTKGWPAACTHLARYSQTPQPLLLFACGRGEPLACKELVRNPPPQTSDVALRRWQQTACARKLMSCR